MRRVLFLLVGIAVVSVTPLAQTPTFDVVSIKRNMGPPSGQSMRTMPDGGSILTNVTVAQFITSATSVPVREVIGLPSWADMGGERYDVTVKPPAGSTREQRQQMWQAMFEERMKLRAHIEEREHNTFALVLARQDGKLGPELKPSAFDCRARAAGPPPQPPPPPKSQADAIAGAMSRCGMIMGNGIIASGGMALDTLVFSLQGLAGRLVNNRTGLQGFYALTLKFGPPAGGAAPDAAFNDAPEIFTALQEQLGLKLQPDKSMVPVFVIDYIERPSEN